MSLLLPPCFISIPSLTPREIVAMVIYIAKWARRHIHPSFSSSVFPFSLVLILFASALFCSPNFHVVHNIVHKNMHNVMYNKVTKHLAAYFGRSREYKTRITRQSDDFVVPFAKSHVKYSSSFVQGPLVFNRLRKELDLNVPFIKEEDNTFI